MIGVDEVGRGSWAGPLLVVAARQAKALPQGLKDSKSLTKKQRVSLIPAIQLACQLGEGWVTAEEVDELGLAGAMRLGVSRALKAIAADVDDVIIMDGNQNYVPAKYVATQVVVRADSLYPIVSAASIYAKVARDTYMTALAAKFPGYGFERHVGYGTARHQQAIRDYGVTSQHRQTFAPIRHALENGST